MECKNFVKLNFTRFSFVWIVNTFKKRRPKKSINNIFLKLFHFFFFSRTKVSEEAGNNKRDIKSSETLPRQKVFSNWGGEFFKKNLDYRANTNKILEKMNLNSKTSNGDTSNNSASSSSAPANSGTGFKSLASSAAGNSKRSALEPAAGNSNNSPAKKLKTTSSSFLNSYSWNFDEKRSYFLCRD